MKKNNCGKPGRRFPLFISLEGKRILVIGGGKIAARRIKTLTEGGFGAKIHVVSPEVCKELETLLSVDKQTQMISWVRAVYDESCLEGADMVLACTSDEAVNRKAYEDCRKRHILFNASSDQSLCDFHFPGIVIEDDVVIAFNGGGMDHKKVRHLRQQTEEWLKSRNENEVCAEKIAEQKEGQ